MLLLLLHAIVRGVEAVKVEIEADVVPGPPGVEIVGVGAAFREAQTRARAALKSADVDLSYTARVSVSDNEAISHADLAIAVAAATASNVVPLFRARRYVFAADTGLTGMLHPVRGVVQLARFAHGHGRGIIVSLAQANEAALGAQAFGARTLREVLLFLRGEGSLGVGAGAIHDAPLAPSLDDVRGNAEAKAAVRAAVAAGKSILLVGTPGSGKTMIARRVVGLMPPLSDAEVAEVATIYSAAGLGRGVVTRERPFRAPHHTISTTALVGGGTPVRPGEASLAHRGVLFLDDLPEFSRDAVEALGQVQRDGEVRLARRFGTVRLPARALIVAAATPDKGASAAYAQRLRDFAAKLRTTVVQVERSV